MSHRHTRKVFASQVEPRRHILSFFDAAFSARGFSTSRMLASPVAPFDSVDVKIAESGCAAPAPRQDVNGHVSWRASQKRNQYFGFLGRHRISLRSARIETAIGVLQKVSVRQDQAFETSVLRGAAFVTDGGLG